MARWKLTAKHYLKVPGTVWSYREQDQNTGKQVTKTYPVPLYLDPEQPADWSHPREGVIIVCWDGKGQSGDIVFEGMPGPDMEPIDDEARQISDSERHKWVHPIESLNGQGVSYGQNMLEDLQRQVATLQAGVAPKPAGGVSEAQFTELQDQVKALMEQNAKLVAQLGSRRA